MTIRLSDHEAGTKYRGDYDRDLKTLQKRLQRIQVAHIVHGRSAIVMFEGWDAAGKGGILQRLTARWDPRHFNVHPVAAPTDEERARPFLWRFWRDLPAAGSIALFDRSWYGRVLVERVEGFANPDEWQRGYDEINAFEAQQVASGTTLVKLFVHVTQEEQDKRLRARIDDPWKRWKTGPDDFHNRSRRADYLAAMGDMFARTDTPEAPWIAIDGNNKKAARIAALTAIAERLEAAVPMDPPPLSDELATLKGQLAGG
ncbi:polyphosphate kinase 2 family protein [Sphingomonas desiccabilis]|uniref:Polyphosphate kinase n=1 Tax=Sphingomonas desiccabilis TaxID=429134 RepID=A0A4Q2IXB3_9SPHN|nr:polyphosphate kinase [Sphingomonas desiccabilis]MBB3910660.1 polyphosphate kinase 2 (PPK2 family) [Sphingomonas desiccabilis]RXZ35285.1 polyphosphate kinase [Sphingomonas desiccabilis]